MPKRMANFSDFASFRTKIPVFFIPAPIPVFDRQENQCTSTSLESRIEIFQEQRLLGI